MERNTYLSLLTHIFSPLHGATCSRVRSPWLTCHKGNCREFLYRTNLHICQKWNTAKSQLPLSEIVRKACYCAPVKITERLTAITKLELRRRCKTEQWLVSKEVFLSTEVLLPPRPPRSSKQRWETCCHEKALGLEIQLTRWLSAACWPPAQGMTGLAFSSQ